MMPVEGIPGSLVTAKVIDKREYKTANSPTGDAAYYDIQIKVSVLGTIHTFNIDSIEGSA